MPCRTNFLPKPGMEALTPQVLVRLNQDIGAVSTWPKFPLISISNSKETQNSSLKECIEFEMTVMLSFEIKFEVKACTGYSTKVPRFNAPYTPALVCRNLTPKSSYGSEHLTERHWRTFESFSPLKVWVENGQCRPWLSESESDWHCRLREGAQWKHGLFLTARCQTAVWLSQWSVHSGLLWYRQSKMVFEAAFCVKLST